MFQADNEECFKITINSVPSFKWVVFQSYNEECFGLMMIQFDT